MAEPLSTISLTAFLFAQYVGEGMGFPSTPKAAYVCGYDQTVYHVKKAGTTPLAWAIAGSRSVQPIGPSRASTSR
mgnify:CR=1 FL=1